jgi:hypothetical protein
MGRKRKGERERERLQMRGKTRGEEERASEGRKRVNGKA